MIRALAAAALLAAAQTGPGTHTVVLDNASVVVERFHLEPGGSERLAADGAAGLVVQLTDGDIDLSVGNKRSSGPREAGAIAFVPARTPQSAKNIAQKGTTDIVVIRFKPGRTPAPSMPSFPPPGAPAPGTDAPPGIERTPLLDNADTRVVRVVFSTTGREPVHTHPYDLITLQLSPGRVEILDGDAKTSELREPGFLKFVPRDRQHAYASADEKPFDILSIAIK
jgi:quercetin dioxygenase-like cupin family protein